MTFDVDAEAYADFMGRFADPLARQLVELLGPVPGSRALDVGSGPGTVTALLVERLGAAGVAAVEPSTTFAAAVRERLPGVDVRQATAEDLPFADASFDLAVAQLVVPFMDDPVCGLSEMRRVVRPGGTVAAAAWDADWGPVRLFWQAAEELAPGAGRATDRPGAREGQLAELMTRAGLDSPTSTTLTVRVEVATFEEWWRPFGYGIGTAGDYFVALPPADQEALKLRCRELWPEGPLLISGVAHVAVARRQPADSDIGP